MKIARDLGDSVEIIYTADDEEPDCILCDNVCTASDNVCARCGKSGWMYYQRSEVINKKDLY